MTAAKSSQVRVLEPFERFSEIVFGLIMVLSFTGAISVAEVGRHDVRTMFIGAIGCNLAWGIIDAVFYLIACLTEHSHNAQLLRRVQHSDHPAQIQKRIAEALPRLVAEALQPDDFARIHAHLKELAPPAATLRLTARNWWGALGTFLLVFLSTFPVVLPFLFIHDAGVALRLSNAIAIVMLFGVGYMLAQYAGIHRVLTGLVMVGVGAVLVALTIALGG